MQLKVAARGSNLSKCQIKEVYHQLLKSVDDLFFEPVFVQTRGDQDLESSLMKMEDSDFFTRECDEMVASGQVDIAIHSAKDLPKQLSSKIKIACITPCLSNRDVVVFKNGYSMESMPLNGQIGLSSVRRQEAIQALRGDLRILDIRGTIERRLSYLKSDRVYGIVVAECALMRLGLMHLPHQVLDVVTPPYQGRLAVTVHQDNDELVKLLNPLHDSLLSNAVVKT